VSRIEAQILWCGYWIGLGVLSSIGLGTGLHTFLLYLVCVLLYMCLHAFGWCTCVCMYHVRTLGTCDTFVCMHVCVCGHLSSTIKFI